MLLFSIQRGLKYAAVLLFVSGVMGMIYGVLGGQFFKPALVALTFVGLFAVINFIISIVFWLPALILRLMNKTVTKTLVLYIGISLGFMICYMPVFLLLKFLPFSPFE